jgi:hypothetical protein
LDKIGLSQFQIDNQANEIDENNILELTYLNDQPREKSNKKNLFWLINTRGSYNSYANIFNTIIRTKTFSSSNLQNEIKKTGKTFDSSQLTYLKNISSINPRLPLFRSKTISIANNPILVQQIVADGDGPTADIPNNCWAYTNSGGPPDKINWYFYADIKNTYLYRNLEIFYFVVDINVSNTKNKPWITIYTAQKNDGSDGGSFYRTRYNYTGFHDNADTISTGKYLFYIGNINSGIQYNKSIQKINLSSFTTGIKGPAENDEHIFLMSIQTNSGAPPGQFDFCVSEAGYKIKNKSQVRFITTP